MKRWIIYAIAGTLALVLGFLVNQFINTTATFSQKVTLEGGTALWGQEKPLAPFELTDKNKQPFTNEQLKGKWSYLFFGYTHCPDVCPTTLQMMAEMLHILDESGSDQTFQAIFISVDPERDKPQTLKNYVEYFDPRIMAATGNKAALDKLTKPLGIIYLREENPQDPEQYLVDHSAQILVINPKGEFAATLSPPHKPAIMAKNLRQLRKFYKR